MRHTYQLVEHHVCLLLVWVIRVELQLATQVVIRRHNDGALEHLQEVLRLIVHRDGRTQIYLVNCVRDFYRTQVVLTVSAARLRLVDWFEGGLDVVVVVDFGILLHQEIVLCTIFTHETTSGGHLTGCSDCLSLELTVHHIPELRVEHHFKRGVPLYQSLVLASP